MYKREAIETILQAGLGPLQESHDNRNCPGETTLTACRGDVKMVFYIMTSMDGEGDEVVVHGEISRDGVGIFISQSECFSLKEMHFMIAEIARNL